MKRKARFRPNKRIKQKEKRFRQQNPEFVSILNPSAIKHNNHKAVHIIMTVIKSED